MGSIKCVTYVCMCYVTCKKKSPEVFHNVILKCMLKVASTKAM